MKKVIYTPDAADKLRAINKSISIQYGCKAAKAIVGNITSAIRALITNEKMGPAVDKMWQGSLWEL